MWDDHTIPTNSDKLINFIRLIRSEYHPEQHGPILVHCSAGVGRSGTFIALDRLLQQLDQLTFYGYLDIYGTVLDMRRCRDKMVQNEVSWIFQMKFYKKN
jgi:cadherin 5 type 2 (VE-cadherin)